MKEKIICIFICLLLTLSFFGTISSAIIQKKSMYSEPINPDYSHNILGEFFTMTTCIPCRFAHQGLKEIYAGNYHPFYYITYVYDKNNNSKMRKTELQIAGSPTIKMDGGYDTIIVFGNGSTEIWKTKINESILDCGSRNVKDIDLSLNVEWLGAVNNHPEDGETTVPIEKVLNWTVTEMKIDVEAKNNEASKYYGHIHVQITEVLSSLWIDKFGKPYTFEFKDYAFNDDVTIDAGDTWTNTIYWDGMDYDDKGGNDWDPHIFDYITQENTMVIAAAMNKNQSKWVDETAGFLAGTDTDPKKFDVYFGKSYPLPRVINNGSVMKYDPPGNLDWETTYYWRIDIWNNLDQLEPGVNWSFTTRGNAPPYIPTPKNPFNGTDEIPIDVVLKWYGGDPDDDETTYDVYFGEFDPFNDPPLVAEDINTTSYDPTPLGQTLNFSTKYAWKIVAWDYYGLNSSGEKWNFFTQPNRPPYPAHDPIPPDGAKNVSVDAKLYWNGSDPNSGDKLTYDVYFGPNPDPPFIQTQDENSFDPYGENNMPLFEDFYWRINTRDMMGEVTLGPNWTFATGLNPKPTPPDIDGPIKGKKQISYNFTFFSNDPDNQKIRYHVDWDDDIITVTDYYESGEIVTLNHTWQNNGEYVIQATAEDWYKEKSDLSTHDIKIPRARTSIYFSFLEIFKHILNASPILRYLLG